MRFRLSRSSRNSSGSSNRIAAGIAVAVLTGAAGLIGAVASGAGTPTAQAQVVTGSSGSGGPTRLTAPALPPSRTGQSCPVFPAFPDADCTGVPAEVTLSAYSGPCTVTTANTVIDAKLVNCDLNIRAAGVVIENSKVNGLVYVDTDDPGSRQWSFTIQDSEVDAGQEPRAAVSTGNMTVVRADIHGGVTAVQCEEKSVSCTVRDSWLHGQYIPDTANWHLGGFLSDGGGNIQLLHNNIVCDHPENSVGEGCTGDVNFIPNFAPISGALVQNNLFGANIGSAYCTFGGEKSTSQYPSSDHIVYRDNVFQRGTNGKCAAYGPVTDFNVNGTGNQWINNKWDDGTVVDPES